MGRFRIQELLDLLFRFGIFLVPLALALIGPLLKKAAGTDAAARRGRTPRTAEDAARERAAREQAGKDRAERADAAEPAGRSAGRGEPIGQMKRIEGRMKRMEGRMQRMEQPDRPVAGSQLPDEGMVIAEVRRLLDKRTREVASESARWSPGDPGPETQMPLAVPRHVAPPETSRHREMPVEGQAPLSHDFETVSERVKDHLAQSLDARESLKGANLPSQEPKPGVPGPSGALAPAGAAAATVRPKPRAGALALRAITSPDLRRMLRQEPLFVLLAAEVFGPCRAAAGLEGSPLAPSALRPWG